MPRVLVIHSSAGKILRTYNADGDQNPDPELLIQPNEFYSYVNSPDGIYFDVRMRKVNGGALQDLPARPSLDHEYDYTVDQWVDTRTIEQMRAIKHKAIENARDKRLNEASLWYAGINVDADPQAKQNLQDKVTAMASRIARGTPTPPQMLVWKDRDNVIHSFPDIQTYKDWLDGFVIALENRGMTAWAWSWQMKDALNALSTFEQIQNFVVPDIAPAGGG